MKIAHIADSHFQAKRLDECVRCFDFIIEYLSSHKPDYTFHAGDLFEKNVLINSPEYLDAIEAMIGLADIAPVYMIRGNHDPIYALNIFENLRTKYPIQYYDDIVISDNKDFNLLTIPYQRPSDIGSGDSVGDIHKSGTESIRNRINDFAMMSDKPNLVLSHISVMNSQFANSERIEEGEVMLAVEDLDQSGIHGAFLGHIHRNQQDIFDGTKISYAGAHYRTRFDEMLEPGFCMWRFEDRVPEIEFIKTPAREMIQINLGEEDTKKLIAKGDFSFVKGADIKLVLEVPQGMNKIIDTKDIMKLVPEGTNLDIAVKVNPVAEIRSKKMSEGLSDVQKLEEWGRVGEVNITSSVKKKLDEIVNHDRGLYV